MLELLFDILRESVRIFLIIRLYEYLKTTRFFRDEEPAVVSDPK